MLTCLTFNLASEKLAYPLGDPPQKIAESLFQAVVREWKEDMPAAFQFAYWLRVMCPPFFHFMMARRAEQAASIPAQQQRY